MSNDNNEHKGIHGGPKLRRKVTGKVQRTCAEPDPKSLRSQRRANGNRKDGLSKAQRRAAERLAKRVKDYELIVAGKAADRGGRCEIPTSHFHRPGSSR